MDDKALGIADIRQMGEKLYGLDKSLARLQAALDTEADQGAVMAIQVFPGRGMAGMPRQAGIVDPVRQGVVPEKFRHGEGVFRVPLLAQGQGFQSLEEEEGIEGTQAGPEIPEQFHPGLDDKGDVARLGEGAENFPEFHAVVAGIGFRKFGELTVPPVEFAAVHDNPADGSPMAADELRCRRSENVGPIRQGLHQSHAAGIIYDERNPGVPGDGGDGLKIRNVQFGIPDGFSVYGPGFIRHRLPELFRRLGIDESHRPAEPGEGMMEKLIRPPVEVVRSDDLVSQSSNAKDGHSVRRLTGSDGQSPAAPFDGRNPAFEDIRRGIHYPSVDITELLEGKKAGRVGRILEDVRRGLINGYGPGAGSGIGGFLASVND